MNNEQVLEALVTELLAANVKEIDNPQWENAGGAHDWRNYIPAQVVEIWDTLSRETRLLAYYMAEKQADREEWD